MLLQPPVVALLLAAVVQSVMAVACVPLAIAVLRHWKPEHATTRQVTLEKRLRLISTTITFVTVLQGLTLPVFVMTADRMAPLLSGAMCAVGTLRANPFGVPALAAHLVAFFAATGWMALDTLNARVPTYPLVKATSAVVLGLAPLFLAVTSLEWVYFGRLSPDIITSCCARVFTPEASSVSGSLANLSPGTAMWMLAGTLGAAIVTSARVVWRGGGVWMTVAAGISGLAVFLATLAAVVSFLAPAVYNDVLHHCPFCLLKAEYHYQGYALYAPLFLATASSVWLLTAACVSGHPALQDVLPRVRSRWATAALLGHVLVAGVAGIMMVRSHLTFFR